MRLEHIALNVSDPAAVAEWYAKHLQMVIKRATATGAYFVSDSTGTSMLELYRNDDAPIPDYAGMNKFTLHLAFVAADLESTRTQLLAAGASVDGEPVHTASGDILVFMRDPFGISFQLVQRTQPLV